MSDSEDWGRRFRRGPLPGGWRENGYGSGRENGPDGPINDLTGNGIVNNGPEKELGSLGRHLGGDMGAGTGARGEGVPGGRPVRPAPEGVRIPGGDADLGDRLRGEVGDRRGGNEFADPVHLAMDPHADLGGDELALRRLLHTAVQDLEPTDGALDHLLRAVPTRRARKRQAIVGMAAAALLFGTAIPAFVHVANSGGTSEERAVNVGLAETSPHSLGIGKGPEDTQSDLQASTGASSTSGDSLGKQSDKTHHTPPGTQGGSSTTPPGSESPKPPSSPVCDADQLGVTAVAGDPDANGTVYGTFHVSNVSGSKCSVTDSGSIGVEAGGAADLSKITVVEHTAGDAATGLPDPSRETPQLLLAPDTAYEVKFAWVPSDSCPVPTPSGPTPTPGVRPDAGSGTDGSDSTDEETQSPADTAVDGKQDGSISVSHTAEPGAPSAVTTIPDACAGTVYRTGVLGAP